MLQPDGVKAMSEKIDVQVFIEKLEKYENNSDHFGLLAANCLTALRQLQAENAELRNSRKKFRNKWTEAENRNAELRAKMTVEVIK